MMVVLDRVEHFTRNDGGCHVAILERKVNIELGFLSFWTRCFWSGATRSLALTNAWGPILGAVVLWLILRAMGLEMIVPDTLQGLAFIALACLGSAWLILLSLRSIFFEPA